MNQIFVESNKSYYHGFVLKEQEIRRIIDLVIDQFKKISNKPVEFIFVLKFKNGAIANTPHLEDVLKQENEGSSSIIRLQINAKQEDSEDQDSIKIDFRNVDIDDNSDESPIAHSIKGQSRDWVFVTSSLIEERLSKIKRKSLDQLFTKGPGKLFYKLLTPLLVLCMMIALLATMPSASNKILDRQLKMLNQIEKKWESKSITDPIEMIIQIEKSKIDKDYRVDTNIIFSDIIFGKPIVIIFTCLILLMIMTLIFSKIYPIYNFVWGNYLDLFSKKENTRKVVLGFILGTILIGVIINLLSNYIWEKL